MSKKRKIWVPIVALVLVAAIAAAGVFIWRGQNAKVVDVYSVANLYDTYWGDTSTLDGNVSAGKVQNVLMQDGLIESINVSQGDTVSAGDVLMVYDTASFQLTLQSDQAKIALLESQIELANRALNSYKTLRPAEEMPQPTEEVIDNGELVLRDRITEADYSSGDMTFLCGSETAVSAGFLRALRDSGGTAEFRLYDGDVFYGSWFVDASSLPGRTETYIPFTPDVPDAPETEEGQEESAGADQPQYYIKGEDAEVLTEDWYPGQSAVFNGDGADVDPSAAYGSFSSCTPEEYLRYETVYHDNYTPDGSDNYLYSKAELAEMIKQSQEEIASLQLDLKSAQLTYQKDQLVGETGEVIAAVSGTVTELKDPASLAVGDTLITVKGTENYAITAYISEMNLSKVALGDSLDVYTYESGNSVTATISEIGTTPVSDNYSWNENPNNSYYPITATVDDPDAELTIGEWCEVTLPVDDSEGGGIYLPLMYIRKDDSGSYVMIAGEDGRLKKQYVSTGKTLWGYEIEIKGGITIEDYIAFPYGKTVKEGAPTQSLDYPEFW